MQTPRGPAHSYLLRMTVVSSRPDIIPPIHIRQRVPRIDLDTLDALSLRYTIIESRPEVPHLDGKPNGGLCPIDERYCQLRRHYHRATVLEMDDRRPALLAH